MKKNHIAILLMFLGLCLPSQAQLDSLANFDKAAALQMAEAEGLSPALQQQFVQQAERKYIRQKFNLLPSPPTTNQLIPPLIFFGCNGNEFETDQPGTITNSLQLAGWACTAGQNQNLNPNIDNCNGNGCCPNTPSLSQIVSHNSLGYVSTAIGSQYPIYSVFGSNYFGGTGNVNNPQLPVTMLGNQFIILNNSQPGDYTIERISKSFTVNASNTLFAYAFLLLTQPAHACCESAAFQFKVWNNTQNTLLNNLSYSVTIPSQQCPGDTTVSFFIPLTGAPFQSGVSNTNSIYSRWNFRLLDLSPYLGDVITIEVISADCVFGGHFNQTYFDSQCWALTTLVNGGTSSTVCAPSATLSSNYALPGTFWQGPNSFTAAGQVIATSTVGTYTLNIPNPPFAPITRTLAVSFYTNSSIIVPSTSTYCIGDPSTFSLQGMQTYTWMNGTSNTPLTLQLYTPTATISVQGLDTNGCEVNITQPLIGVRGRAWVNMTNTLICENQSIILQADSVASYNWNVGSTSSSISVQPNVNTIYVVSGTANNGCSYSRSITVNVQDCVGLLEENLNTKTGILPNPLRKSERLSFSNKEAISTVQIYASNGQLIALLSKTEILEGYEVRQLEPAIYTVVVTFRNKTQQWFKLQVVE